MEAIDVIARKPPNTTEESERLMLQALLADHFRLVVHRDSYDLTAYDLVLAKNGPKVKLADRDVPGSALQISPMKGPALRVNGTVSMEQLAAALQIPLESPVTDATGLKGTFDILLQRSPEDAIATELPGATFPPLERALELQLGLKFGNPQNQSRHSGGRQRPEDSRRELTIISLFRRSNTMSR